MKLITETAIADTLISGPPAIDTPVMHECVAVDGGTPILHDGRRRAGSGRRRRVNGQRGFTLIEMLVVITIIGLIMALVGPRVLNYLSESRVKAAKIQIQSFTSALDLFYLDAGRYPSGSEGLEVLVHPVAGMTAWNGPYLKGGKVPNDPWGNTYVYRVPGEHGAAYEVLSLGSSGQEGGTGTAAAITSTGD
jgi:general secretion pathway protein G